MSSRHLLYFSVTSLSQAFTARVSLAASDTQHQRTIELGSTEERTLTLWSASWYKPIPVEFKFEQRQPCVATVHSANRSHRVPFLLGQVISARGGVLSVPISSVGGALVIHCCPLDVLPFDTVRLQFSASGLRAMNPWADGSDTYIRVVHALPDGAQEQLYQSSVAYHTVSPTWTVTPPLDAAQLRGRTAVECCLQLQCWYVGVFSTVLMGTATISIQNLADIATSTAGASNAFALTKKGQTRGAIHVRIVESVRRPRFTELLSAGLNINVAVAIDFTASNGDPTKPDSLHFCHHVSGASRNQYYQAMRSVCDVLLEYDTDKLVPAYGFGAQLPTGQVSHCFHLNAQPDPNVFAVDGIMQAYTEALRHVKLSGPTNFAPCIRQAERAARQTPDTYTILLILTDGCITDTDDTIDAIVACGDAPLSIVIVGVGNADFATMDVLDGDDDRLTNRVGVRCLRDLVQFVPYRDFATASRELLAAEVLEEVPRQVEEWAVINRVDLNAFHHQL